VHVMNVGKSSSLDNRFVGAVMQAALEIGMFQKNSHNDYRERQTDMKRERERERQRERERERERERGGGRERD
jgi:hypothetical protein